MRTYRLLMVALIGGLLATSAMADELIQKYVIEFPEFSDYSMLASSCRNVGDFNADGYDDLVVSVEVLNSNYYEAAYLYYGGPDFDTEADLVFVGPNQGSFIGYGGTQRLGDFNGDGYDDMVINASRYGGSCGKTYFHYGSPNPDTITDMSLHGWYGGDYFYIKPAGDLNNDGFADAYAYTGGWNGVRFMVYLGSSQPDTVCDWYYAFPENCYEIYKVTGPCDINGDGFDDLCLQLELDEKDSLVVFLGGDTLGNCQGYDISNGVYEFIGDISNDGIDDIIYTYSGSYLCLGGMDWDIEPDYQICTYYNAGRYIFSPIIGDTVLIVEAHLQDCFRFYHRGIPFDTTAFNEYSYNQSIYHNDPNIGDIDADGYGELAVHYANVDSLDGKIYIFSTDAINSIDEDNTSPLPQQTSVITSYPNPFNSTTIISYSNIEGDELRIYDIAGRLVRTLACESSQGIVTWDGTNMSGEKLSTGVYFIKATNDKHNVTAKLVYLK